MSIYDSARLAAAYAFQRPAVHRHVIRAVATRLGVTTPVARALDVGCGAGLSTAALEPLAHESVGLEPIATMLAHRRDVAPGARFVIGRAESLPFVAGSFDLLTAAGSLNYVDLDRFLPEAARVLAPTGVLVIYDFSAGRRLPGDDRLDQWFTAFERRYPFAPGYDLDVQQLPYGRFGLALRSYDPLQVAVRMTLDTYLPYAMSETSVEAALARGVQEPEIREWCQSTLTAVFADRPREVLFDAYFACVRRT